MPSKLTLTVQSDNVTHTVIVHDENGNWLGELELDPVPKGFRVSAINGAEADAGQLVVTE